MTTLFDEFHRDHAILGKGFHDISTLLRGGDVVAARQVAMRLDKEAGPHIAFEERQFYPALRILFGDEDVDRFYSEHQEGLAVLRALLRADERVTLNDADIADLVKQSETMESHIAECGELFEAMGRIPGNEQENLLRELLAWREKEPSWTKFVPQDQSESQT